MAKKKPARRKAKPKKVSLLQKLILLGGGGALGYLSWDLFLKDYFARRQAERQLAEAREKQRMQESIAAAAAARKDKLATEEAAHHQMSEKAAEVAYSTAQAMAVSPGIPGVHAMPGGMSFDQQGGTQYAMVMSPTVQPIATPTSGGAELSKSGTDKATGTRTAPPG